MRRSGTSSIPTLMTLCSPDPQAFRPPEEEPNVLHVGLPTNFKVSKFHDAKLDAMLEQLEADIDAYRVDGKDVPVKLRVFDSLFVPVRQMGHAGHRQLSLHHARTGRDRSRTPFTAILQNRKRSMIS